MNDVLGLFAGKRKAACKRYPKFVKRGILEGRRPELVGGGLIRKLGGWQAGKMIRRQGEGLKRDERILGHSDVVEATLITL